MNNAIKEQYDIKANKYNSLREVLHVKYVKRPSIEAYFSFNLKGKRVLDLACGEGEMSRYLYKKGAIVTGLDNSKELISIAKDKNIKFDTDINYLHGDGFKLQNINQKFDFIVGIYFLNYVSSKRKLNDFLKLSKNFLKSDSKMIFLIPDYDFRKYYNNYGIESFTPKNEGDKLKFKIFHDDGQLGIELECFYWKMKTYETAFKDAGFKFREHALIISQEGLKKYSTKFWTELKANPIFKIYELSL